MTIALNLIEKTTPFFLTVGVATPAKKWGGFFAHLPHLSPSRYDSNQGI